MFALWSLVAIACDDKLEGPPKDPELAALCDAACFAEVCFADLDKYSFDACVDRCVDERQPAAEAISEDCGKKHRALMACLDDRKCNQDIIDWWDGRRADGDYICNVETAEFRAACPGIWFAPP